MSLFSDNRRAIKTTRSRLRWRSRGQHDARGLTLVDIVVALVVASLTIIVVAQAFVVIQTIRRGVAGAADAHAAAALALRTLAIAAANAGAGITPVADAFDSCPVAADVATTLRPLAVLITDGGRADRADSLIVRQSLAPSPVAARLLSAATAGSAWTVEAIDGFNVGDRVIATSRDGRCAMTDVTGIASGTSGAITLAHATVAIDLPVTSLLLSLGPHARASTSRYDLVSGTLRSTDVGNGDAANPLVSNIVNVKFQYGIDSDGDGALDMWVPATGAWSAANMAAAPWATLVQIKALRIGVIARTDQVDRTQTHDVHWVLFDCELANKTACPGRLEGTFVAAAGGGYRYRVIETVVPLRNVLWNRTP